MKKNRVRIPKSCSVCRVKKIKCDRKTPFCGSCSENNTGHLCKYDQTAWLMEGPPESKSTASLQKEIFKLRSRITTLEARIEKQLMGLGSQLLTFSTSNSPPLLESNEQGSKKQTEDMILNTDQKSVNMSVKHLRMCYFGSTSTTFLMMNDKYTPELFADYMSDQLKKFKLKNTFLEIQDDRIFNEDPAPDICGQTDALIEDFPELPSLRIVNALVQRFFKVCYKFAPFFDEKIFMNEICLIFKKKKHISQEDINYKRSTISILLTMLRFAYLTLPLKEHHNNSLLVSDRELVLDILRCNVDISSSYIEYSKRLMINPGSLEKIDFRKIQAILLLRVYHMQSPENDNLAVDLNILISVAVQMARLHGLHKDPINLKLLDLDNNDIHLWRKVWALLVYFDSLQAFDLGVPMLIHEDEVETHPPFTNLESEQLWLPTEELKLEKFFKLNHIVSGLIRRAVLLTQANLGINIFEIDKLISEFEDTLNNKMRAFDQLYPANIADNVLELMLRMMLMRKLFSLAYLCFISLGDHGKKYLHIVIETGLNIIRVGYEFAKDPTIVTCLEFETVIAPTIWNPVKVVFLLISGILIRSLKGEVSITEAVRSFKFDDSSSTLAWVQVYGGNEKEILRGLILKFEEYHLLSTNLSVRYFDCYHICITLKYFMNYLRNNNAEILQSQSEALRNSPILENVTKSRANINSAAINDFWNKDIHYEATFDEFLSFFNYNTDPFLNDL